MSEVDHPSHYNSHPSGIEVIEYARLLPFGPGNAVKYVMRRGHKGNAQQDLDKAIWYLNDSIKNHVTYPITHAMVNTIDMVIAAEPDPLVHGFLAAMYLPRGDVSANPNKFGLDFGAALIPVRSLKLESLS